MMAMMMKLAVLVLVCAAVAQTRADAPEDASPEPAEGNLVLEKKRLLLPRLRLRFPFFRFPIKLLLQLLRKRRYWRLRPLFRFCLKPRPKPRTYFRYYSSPKTWSEAEKFCRSIGGNLASARNRFENNKLLRLIRQKKGRYRYTWIGGSDAQQNGIWFWSDGSNYQYTNWCRGQPNNFRGKQHCLQLSFTDKRCWDDAECGRRLPFICAKRRQ
uniref:Galactose-specific lectin nattectin-like n=2 Tax=Oryzias melastigma TaxID=30732 RepID=A0A3B3CV67_ORYME